MRDGFRIFETARRDLGLMSGLDASPLAIPATFGQWVMVSQSCGSILDLAIEFILPNEAQF